MKAKDRRTYLTSHSLGTERGFTLVELLVAMTISAILFTVIWSFLDSTANTSREVSSMSVGMDEARQAMEQLTVDFEMAGANASPNSLLEPRVMPKGRDVGLVTGLYPYMGWQSKTIWSISNRGGGTPQKVTKPKQIDNNPDAVFDGVVLLGSISYPLPFEGYLYNGNVNTLQIPDTSKGLRRLSNANPFVVATQQNTTLATEVMSDPQWPTRVLRLYDPEGFKQFAGIQSVQKTNGVFQLRDKWAAKQANQIFGVDVATGATDRLYNLAALDMYWYYVRTDPDSSQPNNLQLVRQRLCAPTAIKAFQKGADKFSPEQYVAGGTCGIDELVVLANKVASFDVWFDCGDGGLGALTTSGQPLTQHALANAWDVVDNSCITGQASAHFERARMAHLRLSIHTGVERTSITDPSFYLRDDRLWAFDANPDYVGASMVTTLQSDVYLRNYLYW